MFLSEYEIFLINELIERRIRPRKNAPKPNLRVRFMSKMTQKYGIISLFLKIFEKFKKLLIVQNGYNKLLMYICDH